MKKILLIISFFTVMALGESSFEVDGVYGGMTVKELIAKKLTKKNGEYKENILVGKLDTASSMMYGGLFTGDLIGYTTNILDKKARISILYTKKSKLICAVIVEWINLSMDESSSLIFSIEKSLNSKYTEGKDIDTKEFAGSPLGGKQWKPNENTKIYAYTKISPNMALIPTVIYIDNKYLQRSKDELKPAEKTNKL